MWKGSKILSSLFGKLGLDLGHVICETMSIFLDWNWVAFLHHTWHQNQEGWEDKKTVQHTPNSLFYWILFLFPQHAMHLQESSGLRIPSSVKVTNLRKELGAILGRSIKSKSPLGTASAEIKETKLQSIGQSHLGVSGTCFMEGGQYCSQVWRNLAEC